MVKLDVECLRYSSAIMTRSGTRERPALLATGTRCTCFPKNPGWAWPHRRGICGRRPAPSVLRSLAGHARGQHRQRRAQVNHVIDARAEEFGGGGAGKHQSRTPRKNPLLEIKLVVLRPDVIPEASVHAGSGDSSGEAQYVRLQFFNHCRY